MENILISVVIANYNRPVLVKRAITSALIQKTATIDIEVLVCDDASTNPIPADELAALGAAVKYLRQPTNQGPQAARNMGIAQAAGKFVFILDDDDEFLPGAIAAALADIYNLSNWQQFPVFQFAHSNGYIPATFAVADIDYYMTGKLKGDFAPVIQTAVFKANGLRYPTEILNVGCEHLLWWKIALKWGIPSWTRRLMNLYADADVRMTSGSIYIKRAEKYALMEDLSVEFLRENQLTDKYRDYYNLKITGSATYYLLAGNRKMARRRLSEVKGSFLLRKTFLKLLTYMPESIVIFLFGIYRR